MSFTPRKVDRVESKEPSGGRNHHLRYLAWGCNSVFHRIGTVLGVGLIILRIASRVERAMPAGSRPTSANCSRRVAWAMRRSGMPRRAILLVEMLWATAYSNTALPKPFWRE